MSNDQYKSQSAEELAKLLSGDERKDSTVLYYFMQRINELLLSGDNNRIRKILKPLMYLYGYDYDWLRMYYFICLDTNAEKEECFKQWEKKISFYPCYFHIKNFSIPAASGWFMLGSLMGEPYLTCKDYINDPWFNKTKNYLKSEYEKDPKNCYILYILLIASATPAEYLRTLKKIIELDPTLEKDLKIANSINHYLPIRQPNYIDPLGLAGMQHETIWRSLYRLLRENIIGDPEDKEKAEEIIRLIYLPNENRETSFNYWELLYYCQRDESGKIACLKKMLAIDPENNTAKMLNRALGYKVEVTLHQCGICGNYFDILKEGLCDNCYKQVDHSWERDAMDTYRELSDPFDEGTDIFED